MRGGGALHKWREGKHDETWKIQLHEKGSNEDGKKW